tara:strand:+ start:86 stop:352 length:267 start_codon:yes stop_codon:yes gene_type:complete
MAHEAKLNMKDTLLKAFVKYAEGNVAKHKANVHVYLNNPAGIGEHSDIMEAIEQEADKIAKYDEMIDVIKKHFKQEMQYPDFVNTDGL